MGGYSGVFNRSISGNAYIDAAEVKFEGAGGVMEIIEMVVEDIGNSIPPP
jgi:hypothetical protein